jgi:hypothetical protein
MFAFFLLDRVNFHGITRLMPFAGMRQAQWRPIDAFSDPACPNP